MQRSIENHVSVELAIRDKPRPTQHVAAGLLSLPNELLAIIWSHIPRLDIESMSLVNRRVHRLGEKFIERHRRLKNRYRRGKIYQCINASISCSGKLGVCSLASKLYVWDLRCVTFMSCT